MLVRLAVTVALALSPIAAPTLAAGAMPTPSAAAVAAAHCTGAALAHVDSLPASAWAEVAFPTADEQALRAKGNGDGPAAMVTPTVRVFSRAGGHTASVIAQRRGGTWTLWVTDNHDGTVAARKATLNGDRAQHLNRILADACFFAEPTDLTAGADPSMCPDPIDFYVEAVTDKGRRSAVEHCTPLGLTGDVADLLWNQGDIG